MSDQLLIRNVTVIDGTDAPPLAGVDVVIDGDRFTGIRPAGNGRSAATVIDGSGRYLIPGLWEGHTHLRARPDEGPVDQIARLDALMAGYLRAGITNVLELGGPLDIDCSFRERHRTVSAAESADLCFAGPSFTGIDGWPLALHHNRALVREAGDAETARRMVDEFAENIDFVKCIYDGEPNDRDKLPREALEAIVASAHERGKKVMVNVRTRRDIEEAVDAGADCIEHAFVPSDPDDPTEAEELAKLLARTGTYFCPTFTVFEQLGRSGDPAYLTELEQDGLIAPEEARTFATSPAFGRPFPHHPVDECLVRLDYATRTLPIFRQAGVKIAAGSDIAVFMSRPAALLRELQLLSKAGLSPHDVIVAATGNTAGKIGKASTVGTIAPGSIADAVLFDADPLVDVRRITDSAHRAAVIRRGHVTPLGKSI